MRCFVLCVLTLALKRARGGEAAREYTPSTWSSSFYQPHELQLKFAGMMNAHSVFFATESRVSALREGLLTPVVEVHDATITAFHLCNHRSSILYETLSKAGGELTIFEYSLIARESVAVRVFQDTVPATSLACVDQILLRASPASLVAASLQHGSTTMSVLQKFQGSDVLGALAVGYAADVLTEARIFAVAPGNRSLLRLHLQEDVNGGLHVARSEELLSAGTGSDGSLADGASGASVLEPQLVAWDHDKLLFVDGCALRELKDGQVRTLAGSPTDCVEAKNETLQPFWDTRLSRAVALATEAEATTGGAALLLTAAQVVLVSQHEDLCMEVTGEKTCVTSAHGCGWTESSVQDQQQCFSCKSLQDWAEAQRPVLDACSLEFSPRLASTRYSLTGCGCKPPPAPQPTPGPGTDASTTQAILAVLVILAGLSFGIFKYRARRRAEMMQDFYGLDIAEFRTFTDDDCGNYRRA
eukprot:TRINITY_DN29401_c0_g1_i1.p1 TRINITY_DN29401_c0_g1~~TRINITY_DN29401_c0_g1_i1.p1  ORF type:complete len:472 (+),score=93.77 TRINITY_DN29401_c0_g1_i1:76-1491(+)